MSDISPLPATVGLNRRQALTATLAAPWLLSATELVTEANAAPGPASLNPDLFAYLTPLRDAVAQLQNTWKPEDPAYQAENFQQILMNFSYAYFVYFFADAEHPDWAPLWNPVYRDQPNPDDIYLYAPIRGDLRYRVSGNRGTVRRLIFVTQNTLGGMSDDMFQTSDVNMIDDLDMKFDVNGEFELIFSAERPVGYTGNWSPLGPTSRVMMVRFRSWDWGKEHDPQISIECLDPAPPKKRLTAEEILDRIGLMAKFPGRANHDTFKLQNAIKAKVGINRFDPVQYAGLSKQVYWPAVFQLDNDEALIIETEMPKRLPYWNIQLNDPLFNAIEYVYRLSSLNGATARIGADGKLRAVIALTDPGVPNWLDPSGFNEGTIYGRWYDTDTHPTPTLTRVKLAELRKHLPADTPHVTPAQRAEELRIRIRAAQRRRRW